MPRLVPVLVLVVLAACAPRSSPESSEAPSEGLPSVDTRADKPAPASPSPRPEKHDKKEERATERRPSGRRVLVTRVIDGDTIEVRLGGRIVDIRLIGVDTPETVAPGQPVACYGPEASRFTGRALEGSRVRLTYDAERRDRYGRTLAYAFRGGRMFNMALVSRGFATVEIYPPNDRYAPRLYAAERSARARGKGLWHACRDGGGQNKPKTSGGCDRSYPAVCIPPPPPDLDCDDVKAHRFRVRGSDPHYFDGDRDGVGCET
ncbi:MAG: thermonuclease family protein [Actinomycetota bacterium]